MHNHIRLNLEPHLRSIYNEQKHIALWHTSLYMTERTKITFNRYVLRSNNHKIGQYVKKFPPIPKHRIVYNNALGLMRSKVELKLRETRRDSWLASGENWMLCVIKIRASDVQIIVILKFKHLSGLIWMSYSHDLVGPHCIPIGFISKARDGSPRANSWKQTESPWPLSSW